MSGMPVCAPPVLCQLWGVWHAQQDGERTWQLERLRAPGLLGRFCVLFGVLHAPECLACNIGIGAVSGAPQLVVRQSGGAPAAPWVCAAADAHEAPGGPR